MTIVSVSKEVQFDAAHRVPLHGSKCKNLHGHRYRVVAHVSGPLQETGPGAGMVVDFGDLKAWLTEHVHDVVDHGLILQTGDPAAEPLLALMDGLVPAQPVLYLAGPPTAENLGRWVFEVLDALVEEGWGASGMQLEQIDVWETPTSCATVRR